MEFSRGARGAKRRGRRRLQRVVRPHLRRRSMFVFMRLLSSSKSRTSLSHCSFAAVQRTFISTYTLPSLSTTKERFTADGCAGLDVGVNDHNVSPSLTMVQPPWSETLTPGLAF